MDWIQFLTDNSISFVSRGPNTKHGEVSIQCPWCGEDDPSEHLGINLTVENWGCHRNSAHRGHSATWLIAAILGCSRAQAEIIVKQYSAPDPNTLDDALASLTNTPKLKAVKAEVPVLPDEFRVIKPAGLTVGFWRYLERRGFYDVQALVDQYELRCCLTGRWAGRVILPLYASGLLVGWTARAISSAVSAPRYLTSSEAVKTIVFNEDELAAGGDILFITEGPFDALKVDFFGQRYGARATCTFGTSMGANQVYALSALRKRFRLVVILLDFDAVEQSFLAEDWLSGPNVCIGNLPLGVKDPGAMSSGQVANLVKGYKDADPSSTPNRFYKQG